MWQRNLFSVSLVFVAVSCEKDVKTGSRKARLFTFNTVNDDIRVDLDFSIPFISIPVKPTMENVFGSVGIPSVNVNLPSLVLGGGIILATTVFLPLLMKTFAQHPQYQRYAKVLEHTQFGADSVLDFANNVLSGGMKGCALRVACWSGQSEHEPGCERLDRSYEVSFDIKGVVAPVFTPTDKSGHVNYSIIPEYIDYLHKNGVQGILVGGTTGESITLTLEERQAVLEAWMKAKPQGMKVIMQVGGVPMPDVIKMAEYAEQLKADAIMTLPEIYYKPKTVEHLVDYLQAVSSAAPSLPLLYYHFPMMSGVDLNMPEFFKLASSKIPNFKGMKADLGVALQVSDQFADDQRIFIGNHLLAPAVLLGHDSSIATVTNMFPKLVTSLIDAVKRGEVDKAKALQEKMNALVTAIASQGEFLPAMKAAMPMITGIKVGPPRRPLASLDGQKKTQLKENLMKLNYGLMD